MPEPWNLFYSYSHEDALLRDELAKFLAPLKHQGRIIEWYDRKIEPGLRWEDAISDKLHSADLVLLLVSAAFLASDYCFGVEMEVAMRRVKNGNARVVPILLKPCLWRESRFSDLQLLPRDAKPVTSWPSHDDAFTDVAVEIGAITKGAPLAPRKSAQPESDQARAVDLTVVRDQIVAYARLYERIRQQMAPSRVRTDKLQEVFDRMKVLANAAFPLLPELATSHSPGEKLAAVSILECFGNAKYLGFLVDLVRSEKPFIGYHAARALEFAVSAIEPRYYPQLRQGIDGALDALNAAVQGFDSDRKTILGRAQASLQEAMETVTLPAQPSDS
jgi:TIR domain